MVLFQNEKFNLEIPAEWQLYVHDESLGERDRDDTVYTFFGPEEDGMQHLLTINLEPKPRYSDAAEYAHAHNEVMSNELKGYRPLKTENVESEDEFTRCSVIATWAPVEGMEQFLYHLYVAAKGLAGKLTINLTRKPRDTIGLEMIEAMKTFVITSEPAPEPEKPVRPETSDSKD